MSRRTLLALTVVALSVVLLLPEVSSAQLFGRGRMYGGYGGYGYYGNPYYGGYYSPYYGGYVMPDMYANPQPYNFSSPIVTGGYYYPGMVSSSQSLYPPDGRMQGGMLMDNTRALIDVRVPANARVLFDNSPTQQQGTNRRFVTPPLEPNNQYVYKITAEWTENGQQRHEDRTVRLTPGQTSQVNFLSGQQQNTNEPRQPQQQRTLPPDR